ncbi:DNA replication complex GINS protein PSF1 [Polychytrium aggregatum]|uniref:DNA replication complex GINS protein PSF1 n=1 Tax=Polychytrium aggregatum TaxID=110093 RepID=UPI0022FE80CC|nr:DNA replication complex GINS protein PSF1 [Polychytrium aggregatum]KAI9206833.1 DNA replication complex GINS protein PSF1 [Polychytrium aggregatum]
MATAFAEEAIKLIREAKRHADTLPPYNSECVSNVLQENLHLNGQIRKIVATQKELTQSSQSGLFDLQQQQQYMTTALMHQLAVRRNVQCLHAYHRHRMNLITDLIWDLGTTLGLPPELKDNLSPHEIQFLEGYRALVQDYKGSFLNVDLGSSLVPPRDVFVMVRVVKDCGEIMTEKGPIQLSVGTMHYLRRVDVEALITQGYLMHVG